ncbi:MAG TPA: acetoacetate--CoA ligase, partial [Longimicrobiales bacterium]|nr:acetoacetate--CoA ligase [Longimicrobiales bacterium]
METVIVDLPADGAASTGRRDGGRPLWMPSSERIRACNVSRFAARFAPRASPATTDVAGASGLGNLMSALHPWSVREPAAFWSAVWDFCGIVASDGHDRVVDDPSRMPGARWFQDARLSFAENLLAARDADARRAEAIVACNEQGRTATIGWDELRARVRSFASALERSGVGPGDRVAGFLPNIPEAVIAMLATSSLGAIWSSCSPDFGTDAGLDRFGQIEPKVLVCARGALWAGEWADTLERTRAIASRLPSVEVVVVADYGSEAGSAGAATIPRGVSWGAFVTGVPGGDAPAGPAGEDGRDGFRRLPFDHPLYILYSSGTTGPPKCIVHGQGGTLVQHLKELVLHCDVSAGDALCYYTTCGWMMWNWMVSALATGATIVLYDGSPLHATSERMWDVIATERVTHFGTSAKYLALAEKRGLRPADGRDLGLLRTILSTGSPLLPASFDWVYEHVKPDVHLASISGGTDLISCFVLGDPTAPVWRGEIQCAGLGMRVDVWDDEGRPLPPERKGELVCTLAFPSMPVGFWDDADGSKYRAAYFEHFDRAVWRHGDWIERTAHGG